MWAIVNIFVDRMTIVMLCGSITYLLLEYANVMKCLAKNIILIPDIICCTFIHISFVRDFLQQHFAKSQMLFNGLENCIYFYACQIHI